eukprot:CAMPEP_0178921426 /NCGR_PEP_ID=MMETSP0786-20121207/15555_1 /TAXON_ID=186022 /ORGANISM="Thalassionema frauenfeldii, Strain CCMP 1798" /LENGTH=406 /DNA_ID=CAMNT_0020595605 /DNA_START=42 /DNA_END=1262 /DNA_ORIENTATION=+
MSLVSDIFGEAFSGKQEKTNATDVFEVSSSLPAKPNHKNKTPNPIHNSKNKNEATSSRRKKAKRKRKEEDANGPEEGESNTISDDTTPDNAQPAADSTTISEQKGEDSLPTFLAEERTIFVGNLPPDTTRKSLTSLFRKCGKVQSARLRSIATTGVKVAPDRAGDQHLVKKVCANTNKVDTKIKSSAQGYVVFVEQDSIEKALAMNNTPVQGYIIRVDNANNPTMDASRSVFVGNLPYQADETSLREHFCTGCDLEKNEIENVRIVRNKDTLQCKGFGYVLFKDRSMVSIALQQMHDSVYKRRNLRVSVCGKRTKGRRGATKETGEGKEVKKKTSAVGALQRILKKQGKDRKRGGKNKQTLVKASTKPGNNNGMSRRQVSEAKLEKRHRKLQKRAAKGMGKMKVRS